MNIQKYVGLSVDELMEINMDDKPREEKITHARLVIAKEREKPEEEQDQDLIQACKEYIEVLEDDTYGCPITDSEMERFFEWLRKGYNPEHDQEATDEDDEDDDGDEQWLKVCRVRCKLCSDVLERTYRSPNDHGGGMMTCKCGKVSLDPSPTFWRVNGNPDNYEILHKLAEVDHVDSVN